MPAVVGLLVLDDARLQVVRIALEEFAILLRIFLGLLVEEAKHPPHHGHAQLLHQPGVLHAFSADVHGHVLAIHDALHPMQPLRDHSVSILLHHDSPGVQGDADLRVPGEHPAGCIVGVREVEATLDRERGIGLIHQAVVRLSVGGAAEEPEELGVLLLGGRCLHPECLLLVHRLVLAVLLDENREVDEGGKLLGGLLDGGELGKLRGVVLQGEDDPGASRDIIKLGDGVRARAVRRPQVALAALLRVARLREDFDLVGDHEGRVEADTELADDLAGVRVATVNIVQRAALGDGAEMRDELFARHAHSGILDGKLPLVLRDAELDLQGDVLIVDVLELRRALQEAELLASVGGIRDQLPDEHLLVGVQRLRHDVQQLLGLGLELVLLRCGRAEPPPLRRQRARPRRCRAVSRRGRRRQPAEAGQRPRRTDPCSGHSRSCTTARRGAQRRQHGGLVGGGCKGQTPKIAAAPFALVRGGGAAEGADPTKSSGA
mmetsp:Transcript_17878/g.47359  ORF Transcript_17878/g.47359 Transcript_17878/m.47359 type:complete len:491 (+) Transcript_17878:1006-2478(+)